MIFSSIPPEGTYRVMADAALQAQPSVAKPDELFSRKAVTGKYLWQQHIEDSSRKTDGGSGHSENGGLSEICHKSHISRLRWYSVSYDVCSKGANR